MRNIQGDKVDLTPFDPDRWASEVLRIGYLTSILFHSQQPTPVSSYLPSLQPYSPPSPLPISGLIRKFSCTKFVIKDVSEWHKFVILSFDRPIQHIHTCT